MRYEHVMGYDLAYIHCIVSVWILKHHLGLCRLVGCLALLNDGLVARHFLLEALDGGQLLLQCSLALHVQFRQSQVLGIDVGTSLVSFGGKVLSVLFFT